MVSVEFDPEANAMYIKIKDGKIKLSEPISDNIIIDFDENDDIIGIEILLPAKKDLAEKLSKAITL